MMDLLPTIIPILVISTVAPVIISLLERLRPEYAVTQLLFDGPIDDKHKTKYFLTKITDRYKDSISGFNRAMAFNIGFALIAFYAYFALPSTGTVTIPFISLPVSRLTWISLVPLISYGLQTFIVTSFVWFMVLRLGMKLLYEQVGATDDFSDVTNILLDGALGHVWIIFKIGQYFQAKINLVWYIPAVTLFLVIITSPVLTCVYFIVQLFLSKSPILGIIYSVFFIPYSSLFLLLLVVASILGFGEFGSTIGTRLKVITNMTAEDVEKLTQLLK